MNLTIERKDEAPIWTTNDATIRTARALNVQFFLLTSAEIRQAQVTHGLFSYLPEKNASLHKSHKVYMSEIRGKSRFFLIEALLPLLSTKK